MKELSIEEKAKRYDEAIERAKYYQKENGSAVIFAIFPELKESEDEAVRKELLAVVGDLVLPDDQQSRFVTWLEKQEQVKDSANFQHENKMCKENGDSLTNEDEKVRKALIEYFNEQCDMSDWNGVYGYQVVAWLEKQGEQKSNPYSGVSFEYNGHTWGMCARDGGVEIGYDNQLIANINPIQEKDKFDNLSKPIDNKEIGCNAGDFMFTAPNHGI